MCWLFYCAYLPSSTSACAVRSLHQAHTFQSARWHLMSLHMMVSYYRRQWWLEKVEVCQPFARFYCPQKRMAGMDSYLITSSRDRSPVLATTRNRWNRKLESVVLSGATLTDDELPRVLALSFLSKAKDNTGIPVILTMMSFPTGHWRYFSMQAPMRKSEHEVIFALIFKSSDASLSILAPVESLWCKPGHCSPVWQCTQDIMGADILHNVLQSSCCHESSHLCFLLIT